LGTNRVEAARSAVEVGPSHLEPGPFEEEEVPVLAEHSIEAVDCELVGEVGKRDVKKRLLSGPVDYRDNHLIVINFSQFKNYQKTSLQCR
jgi:hypothetical protein